MKMKDIADISRAKARIAEVLGSALVESMAVRTEHSRNEAHFGPALPDAVAFVRTAEEVSKVLAICHDEGCPVTAWAAVTALEGQHLPVFGGITLNMMEMNRVKTVHTEDMDAVVEPGVTREQLNEDLRATGLFFSVDPGANASLGGMAATRASGTTALRYGTMRDNIRALEVVLANGQVIRTGSRARKSSSGYDLTGAFVGSEGTLGIITELTVKLHGVPEAVSAAVVCFSHVDAAVQTVIATIQMGIPVARMELLDTNYAEALNHSFQMDLPRKPHLFLEFHGSETGVQEVAETLRQVAEEHGGSAFSWKTTMEDRNALWRARHGAYEAMCAKHPGRRSVVTDVCVPVSRLSEMIEAARADIAASEIPGAVIGHVGDGNFHAQLMVKDGDQADLQIAKGLARRMSERALSAGGTITGEHGIGLGKKDLMEAEHGPAWAVMGDMKQLFDPKGILNPGKLVR